MLLLSGFVYDGTQCVVGVTQSVVTELFGPTDSKAVTTHAWSVSFYVFVQMGLFLSFTPPLFQHRHLFSVSAVVAV